MQDVRIRIGVAAILSGAAFFTIEGALAAFIWWLVFSHPLEVLKRMRVVFPVVIMIVFFSIIMEMTGGGGFSYSIRMIVILLIGMWLYCEYHKGEFLHLGTWMFGDRAGFELGMLAEMGMQSLDMLSSDFVHIRQAQELKGVRLGVRSLIPTGIILVQGTLRRANDAAELMAVRGYTRGGTFCPEFSTTTRDILEGLFALCMVIISFIPASEFFILYR
jgi:energy-coupling factor transporter transmembrane protein EcfT